MGFYQQPSNQGYGGYGQRNYRYPTYPRYPSRPPGQGQTTRPPGQSAPSNGPGQPYAGYPTIPPVTGPGRGTLGGGPLAGGGYNPDRNNPMRPLFGGD